MSQQDIEARLAEIGVAESEIPDVMRDVGGIILGKVSAAFLDALPEQTRLLVRSLEPSELEEYLRQNAASLPQLSQEEFDAIHDETWRDYLESIR